MRRIHVAAGVLVDDSRRVLLQRRKPDAHQADLWEFPGGKLEDGEDGRRALDRELLEELGINILEAGWLLNVDHSYPDLQVTLEVWMVNRYRGRIEPLEQQPLAWVALDELHQWAMPAADRPIVDHLRRRLGKPGSSQASLAI